MQGYSFPQQATPADTLHARLCALLTGTAPADARAGRVLMALAGAQGVAPLLRERLMRAPGATRGTDDVPTLRDLALVEAALEARRNVRLATALGALADAGVPTLVFKGTALAHSHYARPELRPRDDTDLLVRPEHADAAGAVLRRLGFEQVPGIEGSLIMRQRLYRQRDPDGVLHNLDVHWSVTNSARGNAFEVRALMARACPLASLSPHAMAPDEADTLLLACLHLDAHHAGDVRLVWLHDVHLLCTSMTPAARQRASHAAVTHGIGDACAWVLAATRRAFATPLDAFENLLQRWPSAAPPSRRTRQWMREFGQLSGAAQRARWVTQHLLPPLDYLRQLEGEDASAWSLNARRMGRGAKQLLRW